MINKKVILGISGGIAAYKSCELLRLLCKEIKNVQVVMTSNATKFVTPFTFQVLSQKEVITETFQVTSPERIEHIALAQEGDLLVVAPATANILAKFAHGIADDFLTTLYLAMDKVMVVPSMNARMYQHPATQHNLSVLKERGVTVIEPEEGELACGETGPGRFPDPAYICERIVDFLWEKDLLGKKILVTAGPTREYIDAIRFISNPSTGKMGFAIAKEARKRGAEVVLISGPTYLSPPWGVKYISVTSAEEMASEALRVFPEVDIVIKAAAVADFKPIPLTLNEKIEKSRMLKIPIELQPNPDILQEMGKRKEKQILVGFAAESSNIIKNAVDKMKRKNLDLIVANEIKFGFAEDTNKVVIIRKDRSYKDLPVMSKDKIASFILDEVVKLLQ